MFYYPTVLKRPSGCFSTIWLAATRGIKVSRRDLLKVNVINTCTNIMNYVLELVPPPKPGLPLPRFSLYLSSQLQYGVIVVYHRQCALLLEELQSIWEQFLKQRNVTKTDLDESKKRAWELPDILSLMEEGKEAPDPFFGLMHQQSLMPSPTTMIEKFRSSIREASPDLPDSAASGTTASPDSITLRETETVGIPPAEFEGEDFPDFQPASLDFLMAQTDYFLDENVELPQGSKESGEKERPKRLTGSTSILQPTSISSEDVTMLPQPEPVLPEQQPAEVLLTPVSPPGIPTPVSVPSGQERHLRSPDLEDVPLEVETRRKRRRRQLIFSDPETQLPSEEQQRQMRNPLTETRHPVFHLPIEQQIRSASELLNNPFNVLPPEIEFLWRQAAIIRPVSGSDLLERERGPESSESEREMMQEAARQEKSAGLSSTEVQRERAEPEELRLSDLGLLSLEVSDQKELSREISPLPSSDREGSTVSRSASVLQDIPESVDELMERDVLDIPGLLLPEQQEEFVLFQQILPSEANRRTVSRIFLKLLVSVSGKILHVEQNEPYGDIMVSTGPN